ALHAWSCDPGRQRLERAAAEVLLPTCEAQQRSKASCTADRRPRPASLIQPRPTRGSEQRVPPRTTRTPACARSLRSGTLLLLQGCLIAVQPETGEIKAMIGGRDYQTTRFNRVTQAFRQPGSVFKPFTYVAAFENRGTVGDIRATTRIEDEPFTWEYEGRTWS